MEKQIRRFKVNFDFNWTYGVEIKKLKEDLETLEKLGVTEIEIEAEDKYQAILKMHKKTDEEKEQFLIESEEFEEEEDISIDILTSEESKENEHKQRIPKSSKKK